MKFIAFGLLFVAAVYALPINYEETTKDDLKNQVGNLQKEAQGAIQKLIAEGKHAAADKIKSLETYLVGLETQLEKLDPQTEIGKTLLKGLETLVKAAEGKLEEEIKVLSGSFYDETKKDDLKNQVDGLKKEAQGAIEKLIAEGKHAVADKVKALETYLVDLESQLEKLNPQTGIGKALLGVLENLVKGAEAKLEDEIKVLSGSYFAETTKDDLKNQVGNLQKEAQGAIQKLIAEGKHAAADKIKSLETYLVGLETQLEKLDPKTEIGKTLLKGLETLVKAAEAKLEEEVKVLSGSYFEETTKNDLQKQVGNLKNEAQNAIQKLIAEGKHVAADKIKALESYLVGLETQLEKLNPQTEIGKTLLKGLETLVKAAEGKLEEEIKVLSGSFYDETKKDDLKNQVDGLKKEAQGAIEKLIAEGKHAVADKVKALETYLVDLESQLEKLNPQTPIGKTLLNVLENLVKGAESKLEEEIKVLSGSYYAETTKDDLKNQVGNLQKEAQGAIQKLIAEGKHAAADKIKALEGYLVGLETQLEKLNPQTDIGKTLLKGLETLVKAAETKLEEEIKVLSGSYYADDVVKTQILKEVGDLYDKTDAGIEELAKKSKTELVSGLKKAIAFVQSIDAKVKSVKTTTELGKDLLKLVEKLAEEGVRLLEKSLKQAEASFYAADPDREALLALVGKIVDEGKAAFEKLAKSDKKVLIEGLKNVIALGKEIETDLKTLNPTTPIGKSILSGVENLVHGIVIVLEGDLKTFSQ